MATDTDFEARELIFELLPGGGLRIATPTHSIIDLPPAAVDELLTLLEGAGK